MRWLPAALGLLLSLHVGGAWALGLGDIELDSALNEPLNARIPLRSVSPGDLEGMRVGLASEEQFRRAGLEWTYALSGLRFEVVERTSGAEVRLSTEEPVAEPFLNFLVEVEWPQGRVIREYTLLLDPPVYGAAIESTVGAAVATVEELPDLDAELEAGRDVAETQAAAPSGSAPARLPSALPGRHGPVGSGETLWSLASSLRPEGVTVNQAMLALLRANPDAFVQGNVNRLQAGAVLQVPDLEAMRAVSAGDALAEIQRQNAAWEEFRQTLLAAAEPAPAGAAGAAGPESGAGEAVVEAAAGEDEARLELVSAGTASEGAGGAGGEELAELENRLSLALEEADSVRRENEELESRLSEAESLIGDLERLIELKDDDIAALQAKVAELEAELEAARQAPPETTGAEVETPAASTPETTPEPTEAAEEGEPAAEVVAEAAPEPEPAAGTEPGQQTPQVPLPPAEGPPQSFVDRMLAMSPVDPMLLAAGGGGVLVLLLAGVMVVRRRRAAEWVDVGAGEAQAAAAAGPAAGVAASSEAGQEAEREEGEEHGSVAEPELEPEPVSAPEAATERGEPEEDPLEGVNIYLAYERYKEAADLVRGVIARYPDRPEYRLRLLEIFYAAKDLPSFEAGARELQDAVGEDSPLMEKAREWWQELSPTRPLFAAGAEGFQETVVGMGEEVFDVTGGDAGQADTMEISFDDLEAEGAGGGLDFDLGFESEGETERKADSTVDFDLAFEPSGKEEDEPPAQRVAPDTSTLDFDLGEETITEGTRETPAGAVDEGREEARGMGELDTGSLDFTLDDEETVAAGEGVGRTETMDFELEPSETEAGEKDEDDAARRAAADEGLDFDFEPESEPERQPEGSEERRKGLAAAEDGIDFDLDSEETPAAVDTADEGGLDFALDTESQTGPQQDERAAREGEPRSPTLDLSELDLEEPEPEARRAAGDEDALDFDALSLPEDPELETTQDETLDLEALAREDEDEEQAGERERPASGLAAGGEPKAEREPDEARAGRDAQAGGLDFELEEPEADRGEARGPETGQPEPAPPQGPEVEETQYMLRDIEPPEPDPGETRLDFNLEEPDFAPERSGEFETVQLSQDDLERSGALDGSTALDMSFEDFGEGSGEVEIDHEFTDVFGGQGEKGQDDQVTELDIELPDSAAAESDDDSGFELDLEPLADSDDDDSGRTEEMLRDIAAITSEAAEQGDEDEDRKTLALGRGASGQVEEMQTKLDLAQAYIDMGDTEGARSILGEVMAEGSDEQKQTARELLEQLR